MPEESCVEINCCPPGFTVPGLGGTLALAGDDTTGTDPNIANGELVVAEEAKITTAPLISGNTSIVVASSADIQQGFIVTATGVIKTITTTLGLNTVTVPDVGGLKIGQLVDTAEEIINAGNFVVGNVYKITSLGTTSFTSIGAPSNTVGVIFTATGVGSGTGTANYVSALVYFPYGTLVTNIVGLTVTLSNVALESFTFTALFRPPTPPLFVGATQVIPSGTSVAAISGNNITLSVAPTASMSLANLSFFPAEIDPNVFDEAELFT